MTSYQYLIVGGGMTADAAAKAIRAADATGSIGIIASEPHPPYARPPLSKSLWKGESEDTVWKHTETANVDLQLGRRVSAIDPGKKIVTDDRDRKSVV